MSQLSRVNGDLGWSKGRCSNKVKVGVANELASEPEEWLLKIVVGLGADVVILEVLFSVEGDGLCLNFTLLVY